MRTLESADGEPSVCAAPVVCGVESIQTAVQTTCQMASISLTPDVSHADCEVEYQTLFDATRRAAALTPADLAVTEFHDQWLRLTQ